MSFQASKERVKVAPASASTLMIVRVPSRAWSAMLVHLRVIVQREGILYRLPVATSIRSWNPRPSTMERGRLSSAHMRTMACVTASCSRGVMRV